MKVRRVRGEGLRGELKVEKPLFEKERRKQKRFYEEEKMCLA